MRAKITSTRQQQTILTAGANHRTRQDRGASLARWPLGKRSLFTGAVSGFDPHNGHVLKWYNQGEEKMKELRDALLSFVETRQSGEMHELKLSYLNRKI